MTKQKLYFLPGRGRKLNEGLGVALIERGFILHDTLFGRELVGAFAAGDFQAQVDQVRNDLLELDQQGITHLIAVSFGAYLFLHAQATLPQLNTKILLLSPIVGAAINKVQMHYYVPPQSKRLSALASQNRYPKLTNIEIHVGDQDWQSPVQDVQKLAEQINIPLYAVPNNGHTLDRNYVKHLLDSWFGN